MKRIAVSAAALALVFGPLFAPSAMAAGYPVIGRIAKVYAAAGGSTAMGDPLGPEHKVRIAGVNGYSQKFRSLANAGGVSTVVWNRLDPGHGWATTAARPDPHLAKVANERDGLAATGLAQGLVYRSADLSGANKSDKLNLSGLLRGGVIVDLRSSGSRDPKLPGVKEVRYPMTSTAVLSTFVVVTRDRVSLGRALKAVAGSVSSGHSVLIHCHLGRDRTGWASVVLEALLGAPATAIRAAYLKSPGAHAQLLSDALATVASHYPDAQLRGATYPGIYRYVTKGLGLSGTQVAQLRAALG